jgi:hypothetical protein
VTFRAMPFASTHPHEYWSIDIHYIDHPLGGNVYCINLLDNYSRTILASALSRNRHTMMYLIIRNQ